VRVEVEESPPAGAGTATAYKPPVTVVPRPRRLDRFDLGVLVAFALVSVWTLGIDLWQVIVHGLVWTGTDGLYLVDQQQYAAWIRDASQHFGLVSNLFVLRPTPADYFQPAVAISGGLTALGVAPWLSLLLWKPVAVISAFYAIRIYVRRSLTGLWSRRAALVLALFFGSFTLLYGSVTTIGDLFPGFLSWGYVFALMGLAAMTGGVLLYERAWTAGRLSLAPGLLGLVAGLMHPWNGEMLIAVVVGTELVMWGIRRRPPRLDLLAVTVALSAAALLYYAILGKTDLSWQLAQQASRHTFPLWSIVLASAPLLVPALLAYRKRPENFLAAATRFWLFAAFAVFVVSGTAAGATPLHAFQGITIPLSVLAIEGITGTRRWRLVRHRRRVAAVAIALVTIPATVFELSNAIDILKPAPEQNANFITKDENDALRYLAADRAPGGVLTRSYLGAIVPAKTGRRTFIGDCLWSEPDCNGRTIDTMALFDGSMAPADARHYVLSTGARFVLADCGTNSVLATSLAPIVKSVHQFGCAAVYEVN
jgi:hypothetical protein